MSGISIEVKKEIVKMEPKNIFGKYIGFFDEGEEMEESSERFKCMRKISKKNEKRFPAIVLGSIVCQSYHIARCEKCDGCDFAINGCEKVFEMSAG